MHVAVGDCLVVHRLEKIKLQLVTIFLFSLRPKPKDSRNNLSCCCSWIFHLIYELSTPTTVLPLFFIIISLFYHYLSLYLPCYLSITVYLSLYLCIYQSIYLSLSVNLSIDTLSPQTHKPVSVLLFSGKLKALDYLFISFLHIHSFFTMTTQKRERC